MYKGIRKAGRKESSCHPSFDTLQLVWGNSELALFEGSRLEELKDEDQDSDRR